MSKDKAKQLAQLRRAYEFGILDEDTYQAVVNALGGRIEIKPAAEAKGGAIRLTPGDAENKSSSKVGEHNRGTRSDTPVRQQQIHSESRETSTAQLRQHYLKRLGQRFNVLPLAAMGGDEETGEEITLDQIYVALDTSTRVPITRAERDQWKKDGIRGHLRRGAEDRPLSAMEVAARHRRLVLLGDPGSGKSTFVGQLSAWLATAARPNNKEKPSDWEPGVLPVFMALRDLALRLVSLSLDKLSKEEQDLRLAELVRQQWRVDLDRLRVGEFAAGLEETVHKGQVLLIFDGLDEVPDSMRPRICQAILAVLSIYPAVQRVIVTCRIRSYTGSAVLPGFETHTLVPFSEEKVRQFVRAWYRTQAALGRLTEDSIEENARDLQTAALSEELRELASNPMLLTTMAIIHQREVGLPRERVRLYSLAVQVLLSRWQKRKGIMVSERLAGILADDLKLRTVLERLAYEAHRQMHSKKTDLLSKDLLALLEDSTYLGDAVLAAEFLDYLDHRAGMLIGRGIDEKGIFPESYAFPHRTIQEYLAGCYLVGKRGISTTYWQKVSEGDYWYMVAQLGAEELLYNRRNVQILLDLMYDLCPATPPCHEHEWRAVLWSQQIAALLGNDAILRDTDRPDGGKVYLERLVPRLVGALRESPLHAIERAEAGRVLAKLGDPRSEVLVPEEMVFCNIPAGLFIMGNKTDAKSCEYDHPQHTFNIPYSYKMAKYPVTNAQFDAFVKAGGYRNVRYWEEAKAAGVWEEGLVKGFLVGSPRGGPLDFGEPFNLPNHPVVGVTWYEALAFTRWLTERLKEIKRLPEDWQIQLPSESEWEKAARGGVEIPTDSSNHQKILQRNPDPCRVFPWGSSLDPDRTNFRNTGIATTSVVGCFPCGASPYGVEDMSGNVCEWTRSLWGNDSSEPSFSYPYDRTDGRENLGASSKIARVLRGGAFNEGAVQSRCTARHGDDPYYRDWHYGFRVIAAPIDF